MALAAAMLFLPFAQACSDDSGGGSGDAGTLDASVLGDGSQGDAGSQDDGGSAIQRSFPTVAIQPGGISYWSIAYFADALAMGGQWLEATGSDWGSAVECWNDPRFDENGLPQSLAQGTNYRAVVFGLHVGEGRDELAKGHVVLTWKGTADIRLSSGGEYLQTESSGPETGALTDGRRVYLYRDSHLQWLTVHEIDESDPITEMHVWLADPADPENKSLEGQLFHPLLLARLRDRNWGVLRFMDWTRTNGSPMQDWADRRLPSHVFQTGVLNPRPPADGASGNRATGVAYEHLIALCNATGLDLWINVPHLATDEFIEKLARLIRYGSDGAEPYDHEVTDPIYPPLDPNLRAYVEYSNEIWSGGGSFPQGNWAEDQANQLGISKAQFNARRFSEVWSIFQRVFEGTQRLVRVAAVWTGRMSYTEEFLQELKDYGPTLDPATEPDVVSPTTYFGNGIQDFVFQQAWLDGKEGDEAYWTSQEHDQQIEEAFDEWTKRLLTGDAQAGDGPDSTGVGGGFPEELHQLALTLFDSPKPLVGYEGGPSIYTNQIEDRDSVKGPLVTRFMDDMNRHPRMADVYRIHLNMALSHGLATHNAFVLASRWGKYGQWGHLEYLDQDPNQAVKYRFLLDWGDEADRIRLTDEPSGQVPSLDSEGRLDPVEVSQPVDLLLTASGGDGVLTASIQGSLLAPGLTAELPDDPPGSVHLSGTPQQDEVSYLYVRVQDQDGDAAWRTFVLPAYGGPDTLVDCDMKGANPSSMLPWTSVTFLADDVDWSGWQAGSGIHSESGNDGLFFAVDAPADEADSTLANALDHNQYWTAVITPHSGIQLDLRGALVAFSIERIDYHAPRRYAIMTSIGGLTAGAEVYVSPRNNSSGGMEYRLHLPEIAAYAAVTEPVEIRIVPFSGQYGGHVAAIRAFKMHRNP